MPLHQVFVLQAVYFSSRLISANFYVIIKASRYNLLEKCMSPSNDFIYLLRIPEVICHNFFLRQGRNMWSIKCKEVATFPVFIAAKHKIYDSNKAKGGFNLMRANITFSAGHVYTEIRRFVTFGFMIAVVNSHNCRCIPQLLWCGKFYSQL